MKKSEKVNLKSEYTNIIITSRYMRKFNIIKKKICCSTQSTQWKSFAIE